MLRIVVDTNLWIRILLGGRRTLPLLEAWRSGKFTVIVSQPLIDELDAVWRRERFRGRIHPTEAEALIEQLHWRGEIVMAQSVPPGCRDPKDQPVLAAAMDGKADAIVTGDADLRADESLGVEMAQLGIALWGIDSLLAHLGEA